MEIVGKEFTEDRQSCEQTSHLNNFTFNLRSWKLYTVVQH